MLSASMKLWHKHTLAIALLSIYLYSKTF